MNLITQAGALHQRILGLQQWLQQSKDAQALENRRSEWNDVLHDLQRSLDQLDWMRAKSGALASFQAEVATARKWIKQSKEILSGDYGIERLTQADGWAKTLSATKKCAELLTTQTKAEWKKHIEAKGAFRPPSQIQGSMLPSTPNYQALQEYAHVFALYQKLTRQESPASAADLAQLDTLAAQLSKLDGRFDFDAPEEVRKFFTAVNTPAGARLSLLTEQVRLWLEQKGQMESYVIKNRT